MHHCLAGQMKWALIHESYATIDPFIINVFQDAELCVLSSTLWLFFMCHSYSYIYCFPPCHVLTTRLIKRSLLFVYCSGSAHNKQDLVEQRGGWPVVLTLPASWCLGRKAVAQGTPRQPSHCSARACLLHRLQECSPLLFLQTALGGAGFRAH